MTFIRKAKGANRTVWLVGRYAFKFPTFDNWRNFLFGLLNNQTEARVGRSGRAEVCPVLWADPWGFVVVMPRVPVMTAAGMRVFDWGGWLGIDGAHSPPRLCVEIKPCSFGLYDGRIVAIDYGWDN